MEEISPAATHEAYQSLQTRDLFGLKLTEQVVDLFGLHRFSVTNYYSVLFKLYYFSHSLHVQIK